MRHRNSPHKRRHRHIADAALDPSFLEGLTGRKPNRDRTADLRKARQLCRQAHRALSLALAGECHDDLLRELWVEDVVPGPDSSRLLVKVVIPAYVQATAAEVMDRLARAQTLLRQSVARAITRKRAPELSFLPIAPDPAQEGGAP